MHGREGEGEGREWDRASLGMNRRAEPVELGRDDSESGVLSSLLSAGSNAIARGFRACSVLSWSR